MRTRPHTHGWKCGARTHKIQGLDHARVGGVPLEPVDPESPHETELTPRQEGRLLEFLEEDRPARAQSLVGRQLAGVRIERLIGQGGMGEVYYGVHLRTAHPIAVKVMHRWLSTAPKLAERFQREGELAAQLQHRNIVIVIGTGCEDDLLYQLLEYVEGESLAVRLGRCDRLPLTEALPIVQQVAAGLTAAHARGIIHRDIKPGNLLLARDGTVKIADFGLARHLLTPGMTTRGRRLGTLPFMAPEQAEGTQVDERVDLYALGVTLYQMLSGQLPFADTDPITALQSVLHRRPEPLGKIQPEIPAAVDALVMRLLEKDREARFPSAQAVHDALVALQQPPGAPKVQGWWRRWLGD